MLRCLARLRVLRAHALGALAVGEAALLGAQVVAARGGGGGGPLLVVDDEVDVRRPVRLRPLRPDLAGSQVSNDAGARTRAPKASHNTDCLATDNTHGPKGILPFFTISYCPDYAARVYFNVFYRLVRPGPCREGVFYTF